MAQIYLGSSRELDLMIELYQYVIFSGMQAHQVPIVQILKQSERSDTTEWKEVGGLLLPKERGYDKKRTGF